MKNLLNETGKLIRGLKLLSFFAILPFSVMFVVQSCQRENYENSETGIANANFTSALKNYKSSLGKISFPKKSDNTGNKLYPGGIETYIEFPENVSLETINFYENANSIEDLAILIDNYDGTLQYEPTDTNSDYPITLPLEQIEQSLNPLVQQSKEYLYTKGFTEQDIQQMIAEENAEETDLIPLVMAVTQAENGNLVVQNNSLSLPVNMAYAKSIGIRSDIVQCML